MTPNMNDLFTKVALGTKTELASPGYTIGDSSISCVDLSAWAAAAAENAVFFGMDRVQTIDGRQVRIDNTYTEWKGIVSGNTVGSLQRTAGNDQDYPAGSGTRVYMLITASWANALIAGLLVAHNKDGSLKGLLTPTGVPMPFLGSVVPAGYLLCYGQPVSRTTYANLYNVIGVSCGAGDGSTTFNLPDMRGRTPIGKDNMGGVAANRSQVSTTINTNGTTTATPASIAGLSVGMSVVSDNVPDGTTIASIGTSTILLSAAATATASGTPARFSTMTDAQLVGATGGSQTQTLLAAQVAAHTHPVPVRTGSDDLNWSGNGGASSDNNTVGTPFNTQANTGDQPHPNMQPSIVTNWIIAT